MIRIFHPDAAQIQAIQKDAGSYYWSICAANFFRQQGLITVSGESGIPETSTLPVHLSYVSEVKIPCGLFEGPLSDAVLERLALTATFHRQKSLHLYDPETDIHFKLEYPAFSVRDIPKDRATDSKPREFIPDDPFLNRQQITFKEIMPSGDFHPCLYAIDPETKTKRVVGVSNQTCRVLGVPIFDILSFEMFIPPLDSGYFTRLNYSEIAKLRDFVMSQLTHLSESLKIPLLSVDHWPHPYKSAFTIRHDYDRLITDRELDILLERYKSKDIKCTWYTLAQKAPGAQLLKLLEKGHEIALHTEANSHDGFVAEVETLKQIAGHEIAGVTAHGGLGSLGFAGDKQWQWGESANLQYGEILGAGNVLPHKINHIRESIPQTADYFVPADHWSFENSTKIHDLDVENFFNGCEGVLDQGWYLPILNHPDLFQKPLQAFLDRLDRSKTWNATHHQVIEWTHIAKYGCEAVRKAENTYLIFPKPLPESACVYVNTEKTALIICEKGTTELLLPDF